MLASARSGSTEEIGQRAAKLRVLEVAILAHAPTFITLCKVSGSMTRFSDLKIWFRKLGYEAIFLPGDSEVGSKRQEEAWDARRAEWRKRNREGNAKLLEPMTRVRLSGGVVLAWHTKSVAMIPKSKTVLANPGALSARFKFFMITRC